ncbi:MAG TPA: hypothetical protein PKA13_12695 [Geminicoccaceae bacterium]|nr:hypothetical protein [Geminicoccus sp.]HMU50625.1 hypothetical protein [Geminicoccaceae bacterium]
MPADHSSPSWPWPEAEAAGAATPGIEDACLACFATAPGRLVLDHLLRVFLERRVPPSASDAELRHVEGQRSVAAWLLAMASPERAKR